MPGTWPGGGPAASGAGVVGQAGVGPGAVRRRDGITLAHRTIPDRVRAQVVAEHRAELDARTRAAICARIEAGLTRSPSPTATAASEPGPPDRSRQRRHRGPPDRFAVAVAEQRPVSVGTAPGAAFGGVRD